MATSQRVQFLSNKSDEISVLSEFLHNPNLIAQLEEEVKKLNALTEDQEAQLHESKILIQQKDSVARELEETKKKLAEEIATFDRNIAAKTAEHEAWANAESKKIADANAALDERKALYDAEEVRLRQYENKLKETAAKMQGLVGQ